MPIIVVTDEVPVADFGVCVYRTQSFFEQNQSHVIIKKRVLDYEKSHASPRKLIVNWVCLTYADSSWELAT